MLYRGSGTTDGNEAGWPAAVGTRQRPSANRPPAATRRRIDGRTSTACVGLGTGSFPVCLPDRSRGAARGHHEEHRKSHGNNHIDRSGTRTCPRLVTYIANTILLCSAIYGQTGTDGVVFQEKFRLWTSSSVLESDATRATEGLWSSWTTAIHKASERCRQSVGHTDKDLPDK